MQARNENRLLAKLVRTEIKRLSQSLIESREDNLFEHKKYENLILLLVIFLTRENNRVRII